VAAKEQQLAHIGFAGKAKQSSLFSLMNLRSRSCMTSKDTAEINRILRRPDVQAFVSAGPLGLFVGWSSPIQSKHRAKRILNLTLSTSGAPENTAHREVINDARLEYDQFARPAVSMNMNGTGSRAWAKITAAQAAKQPQGRVAIVLDNYVYTAPTVQGEIPNGNSQITGALLLRRQKTSPWY